jgi:5-methylcytosine-specific restriction endonuclease McrA
LTPGRRPSRPRKKRTGRPPQQHTSLPTSRNAYADTRQWLLEKHGAVCAYCGRRISVKGITLDHVTPRRGQTAYDRRDNLVLACPACNIQKADQHILAFLLARPARAESLLRYGDHLSSMLLDLAKEIAGPEAAARAARLADPDYPYSD